MLVACYLTVCLSTLYRVKVALKRENIRPWHEVEQEFLECEYRAVRDRQMKELEMEDDIMSKVPIRCVPSLSHSMCTNGGVLPQEPESEAVQRIVRVCSPTTNPLSAGRCMVHERHSASNQCPKRYHEAPHSTMEVSSTGTHIMMTRCAFLTSMHTIRTSV